MKNQDRTLLESIADDYRGRTRHQCRAVRVTVTASVADELKRMERRMARKCNLRLWQARRLLVTLATVRRDGTAFTPDALRRIGV